MNRRWLLLLAVMAMSAGCAATEDAVSRDDPAEEDLADRDAPVAGPGDRAGSAQAAASEAVGEAAAAPSYTATIREVTAEELGSSWRPGCPVPVEDLRRLDVRHWNSEGVLSDGALIVHADHAEDLVFVFERLFASGFPIHSLRPITEFAGDDDRSMAANNSSAFNCREIAGRPGVWSQHAFGGAVDLNPLVNPWVRGSQVDPPGAAAHLDRTVGAPGMVVSGDIVTEAFAAIGWHWGGDWSSTIDYQHFSHDGR
jgi:hypothetical protein